VQKFHVALFCSAGREAFQAQNVEILRGDRWYLSLAGVIADVQFAVLDEILGMGVALRVMPYEFTDREYEPEPQASSSRGGVPPRKIAAVGVLDPPVPPKKRPEPLTPIPASRLKRIFAVIILIGVAVIVALLLAQH
jgi:hypothetical protein